MPRLRAVGAHSKERFRNRQLACLAYAYEHGTDPPEVRDWTWPGLTR